MVEMPKGTLGINRTDCKSPNVSSTMVHCVITLLPTKYKPTQVKFCIYVTSIATNNLYPNRYAGCTLHPSSHLTTLSDSPLAQAAASTHRRPMCVIEVLMFLDNFVLSFTIGNYCFWASHPSRPPDLYSVHKIINGTSLCKKNTEPPGTRPLQPAAISFQMYSSYSPRLDLAEPSGTLSGS